MPLINEKGEEFILPNGIKLVFYDSTHSYFIGNTPLESVSGLIQKVYGDTYANVNPELLKRSSDYGSSVHKELETLINLRKECPDVPLFSTFQEVNNYFNFVEPIYKIEPIMTEKVVVLYNESHVPIAGGRFDMLGFVDGKKTLIDFKTTSTIHKQLVTAQLNLYLKAARDSGYIQPEEEVLLGVVHLSGEKSKFSPIPILNNSFYSKFF